MADLDMKKAREVYASLISMLDSINWSYEKEEEKLIIRSGVNGDDLPVEFLVVVNPKNEVVQFISQLPFTKGRQECVGASGSHFTRVIRKVGYKRRGGDKPPEKRLDNSLQNRL